MCILLTNHPGSAEDGDIHCNRVAGIAGVQNVAQGGHTFQEWGGSDKEACMNACRTSEWEIYGTIKSSSMLCMGSQHQKHQRGWRELGAATALLWLADK